jgi:hypothetical protein
MSKSGSTPSALGVATLLAGLLLPGGLARADRFAALPVPPPPMTQPVPAPTPAAPIAVAPPAPVVTNLPLEAVFPSNGAFAFQNAGSSTPTLLQQGGPALSTTAFLREDWLVVVPVQSLVFGVTHTLEIRASAGTEIHSFAAAAPCPLNFTEVELSAQLETYETYGAADVCCPAAGTMPAFCSASTRVQLPQITVEAAPGPTAPGSPLSPRMCLSQYWFGEPGLPPQPAWMPGGPSRSFTEVADEYCATFEIERLRDGQTQMREVCVPHGTLVLASREVVPSLPHRACSAPPAGLEDDFCTQNTSDCTRLDPPPTCEPHRELCGWPAAQTTGRPATPTTPTTPTTPAPMWPAPVAPSDDEGGAAGSGTGSGTPIALPRPREGVPAEEDMTVPAQNCGCHALGSKGPARGAGILLSLLVLGLAWRARR